MLKNHLKIAFRQIKKQKFYSAVNIIGLAIGVTCCLLIATPIAWIEMGQWLDNFEYRISLEWWMFGFAGVMAIGIAFLTVGSKSLVAALTNPVDSLKNE